MELVAKIKAINKNKYIAVLEAIEIISKNNSNESYSDIATYFKYIDIEENVQLWFINPHHKPNPIDSNKSGFCEAMELLQDLSVWNNDEVKKDFLRQALALLHGCHWEKSCFFNFAPIKNLDLPEAKQWLSDNNQATETESVSSFGTPTISQPDAAHYQRQRDQYKQQAEQLQAENEALKQRISELENKNNSDEPDLLNKIMNSKDNEYYAPDLALSIQLYKYLYIDNTRKDSHSRSVDNWVTRNTGYNENQTGYTQSVGRLREITTPFTEWGNKRNKNYKTN